LRGKWGVLLNGEDTKMSAKGASHVAQPETEVERREFLGRIGKYAAVTPPVVTMMLTASTVPAYAKSSGFNSGEGNGDEGGDPGNSGAHNQVYNNNAQPNSAGAQNEPELDDSEEPN
jgi:hypothetical protein